MKLDLTEYVESRELPHEFLIRDREYRRKKLLLINGRPIEKYTDKEIEWLLKYKEKDVIYELYAVANHSGTVSGGHYYCYAKNFNDDKWYSFNDSSVH